MPVIRVSVNFSYGTDDLGSGMKQLLRLLSQVEFEEFSTNFGLVCKVQFMPILFNMFSGLDGSQLTNGLLGSFGKEDL